MARILLSYIHYPVSAPLFFKHALRQLGHTVVSLGPNTHGRLPWCEDKIYAEDPPDIEVERVNTFPVESALEQSGPVDLVIQMDANFHLTGRCPVPNVVYMIDNHVARYERSAQEADLLFGAHSWGYWNEDKRFRWLPCAYSPAHHYQTNQAERPLDLLLVGVLYPRRIEILNALSPYGKLGVGVGILGKEYNDAYNLARMALVVSANHDLPMRVFENAAQGCLIFCDEIFDLDRLGLKEGVHYVGFRSTAEAINQFIVLMNHPEQVTQIAINGKHALAKETWAARAEQLLAFL